MLKSHHQAVQEHENGNTVMRERDITRITVLLNASHAGPIIGRTNMTVIAKAPTLMPITWAFVPKSYM